MSDCRTNGVRASFRFDQLRLDTVSINLQPWSVVMVLLECRDEFKDKIHRSRNRTFKWTFRDHAILSADVYTD